MEKEKYIPIEWINEKRAELGRIINREFFVPSALKDDEKLIFLIDKQIAYTNLIEEWRKERDEWLRKD